MHIVYFVSHNADAAYFATQIFTVFCLEIHSSRFETHFFSTLPVQVQSFLIDLQFAGAMTDVVHQRLLYLIRDHNWHALQQFTSEPYFWKDQVGLTDKRYILHQVRECTMFICDVFFISLVVIAQHRHMFPVNLNDCFVFLLASFVA